MFRPFRPLLRGQAAPRGAALLAAAAAALISACGTPGAPTPGVTPVPDGKPPAQADGRPREILLARSLRGAPAAAEIWWRNDSTGREFLLTPRGSFGGEHGPCREFTVDVTAGKTTDRLQGTACQQVDALWKLML